MLCCLPFARLKGLFPMARDPLRPWQVSLHHLLGVCGGPAPKRAPGWHWGLSRALLLFQDPKTRLWEALCQTPGAALESSRNFLGFLWCLPHVTQPRVTWWPALGLCQHPARARPGPAPGTGVLLSATTWGCLRDAGVRGGVLGALGAVVGCWRQQWDSGGSSGILVAAVGFWRQ